MDLRTSLAPLEHSPTVQGQSGVAVEVLGCVA
jgi:hypothetical protein